MTPTREARALWRPAARAAGFVAAAVAVLLVAGLLLLTVATPALARPAPNEAPIDRELADAKEALLMGDAETAVRLYEGMYARAPEDPRVLWGLVRAYVMAGLDEARLIPLLTKRLEDVPADDRVRRELGEAYARTGDRVRAHETWRSLLSAGTADAEAYGEVGALEAQYRMHEEAVATYLEGRERLRMPSLFGQELAQEYTALARFDDAIDECLVVIRDHPGLAQWATNNVELMVEQGAEKERIEERMAGLSAADDATPATLAFVGSTYLALGLLDEALDAYVAADALSGEQGASLIEFAGLLRDEGHPAEARRAYLMVPERYPNGARSPTAAIEAARILASSGDPAGGVAELKAVGAAGAGPTAGQALVEAARIELSTLRDPRAALATLAVLSGKPRQRKLEHEAALLGVDAELALGMLKEARARAGALIEDGAEDRARERAMFDLGYIAFLEADVRRCLDAFRAMVEENMAGSLVNDALRLMLVASDAEESGDIEPVRLLAAAHAARLSWNADAARAGLDALASGYAGTSAAVEGLMLLAAVAEDQRDAEAALRTYARVAGETGSIAARAQALLRSGELLEAAGRRDEALAAYTGVLEDLPSNYLSGEARRKIERMRRGRTQEG